MSTRSLWSCACLPLETAERLFDCAARFGTGHDQWQPGRAAIVAVEIHSVFEAGHAIVTLADQFGGAQNTVLQA